MDENIHSFNVLVSSFDDANASLVLLLAVGGDGGCGDDGGDGDG